MNSDVWSLSITREAGGDKMGLGVGLALRKGKFKESSMTAERFERAL